jgi:hypothetical protein
LDGRSDALSSANLEGNLGEAGADSAWSSGIRWWWCFLADAGAEGGVTGADSTTAGCCCCGGGGLVRHCRVVGVDELLLLRVVPAEEDAAVADVEGAPAREEEAAGGAGEAGRAEGGEGGGGRDEPHARVAVAEDAEEGRGAVEAEEPAAEPGRGEERVPAPADERGGREARRVRGREPEQDLLG